MVLHTGSLNLSTNSSCLEPRQLAARQLAEGGVLASEQSIVITTGQSQGSREIQLQISPEWDATAPNSLLQDRLNVYVTAPDSMTTLLDRGRPGTSVFSLTKDRVETAPGISSWDGRILSIDLTPLTASNTAEIRLQLLSQLASSGTRIAVLPVSNRVDPEGSVERLALAPSVPALAGPATEISSWSATSQVENVTENWRYDATTRRFQLDARLFAAPQAITEHRRASRHPTDP